MKWLKKLLLSLLCVCFSVLVYAQDEQLEQKYLSIRDRLTELKSQSEFVTEQLKSVSENLTISQAEAKAWEEKSKTLSENLMSINQQYNDCYEQLVTEKDKNKVLTKLLIKLIISFAIAFGLMILIKVVFIILYAKGIKIPRMVDVLV